MSSFSEQFSTMPSSASPYTPQTIITSVFAYFSSSIRHTWLPLALEVLNNEAFPFSKNHLLSLANIRLSPFNLFYPSKSQLSVIHFCPLFPQQAVPHFPVTRPSFLSPSFHSLSLTPSQSALPHLTLCLHFSSFSPRSAVNFPPPFIPCPLQFFSLSSSSSYLPSFLWHAFPAKHSQPASTPISILSALYSVILLSPILSLLSLFFTQTILSPALPSLNHSSFQPFLTRSFLSLAPSSLVPFSHQPILPSDVPLALLPSLPAALYPHFPLYS